MINTHKREILIFIIAIGLIAGSVIFNVFKSNKNSISIPTNSKDELVELKNRIDILENLMRDLDKKIAINNLRDTNSQAITSQSSNVKEGLLALKEYIDAKFEVADSRLGVVGAKLESYADCMAFEKDNLTCFNTIQGR